LKRILIIGGGGFIGAHLVGRLISRGHKVRVLDRLPVDLQPAWIGSPRVEYMTGDFADHSMIDIAVQDIDVAYHLVSTTIPATSNVDPIFDVQSNLVGTLNFLQMALKAKVKRVIFVSSGGTVYGKPISLPIKETNSTDPVCSYGIVKLAIEKYLHMFEQLHGLEFLVFRLSNPFGEGQRPGAQGAIAAFIQRIVKRQPIEIWGDGSVVRDYIYIRDVVDLLERAPDYAGKFRVFNLGSGQGRSLNEIVESLRQISGRSVECIYKEGRSLDVPTNVLDVSLVKEEFGWKSNIDFQQGLDKTWKWYSSNLK